VWGGGGGGVGGGGGGWGVGGWVWGGGGGGVWGGGVGGGWGGGWVGGGGGGGGGGGRLHGLFHEKKEGDSWWRFAAAPSRWVAGRAGEQKAVELAIAQGGRGGCAAKGPSRVQDKRKGDNRGERDGPATGAHARCALHGYDIETTP